MRLLHFHKSSIARITAAAGLLLLMLNGCKSQPKGNEAFTAPAAKVSIRQFAGTSLTGPTPDAIAADADATAWSATARIVAVEQLPDKPFELIGPAAHLVVSAEAGNLLSPSAKLVYTTRYAPLKTDDTLETVLPKDAVIADVGTRTGAVLVGSTASFEIGLPDGAPLDRKLSRRKVAIQVYRESAGAGYELALVSTDLANGAKTIGDLNQEKIVVHRQLTGDMDRIALAIPMAFPNSTAAGVVVDLTLTTTHPDAATLEAARTDINAFAQEAAGRLKQRTVPPDELAISTTLDAFTSANGKKSLRPTLSFLAQQADAKLSESVILAADDSVLQLIQAEVRDRMPKLPSRDKPTVSWMLDRATIATVASIKDDQATTLLPPIVGALTIYAGEVGRQLDLLQSLAKQSVNSDDLYARIIAEQQIALEDNSPAVRVRAYDWLNERGAGPADYDPLGPARARRNALDKYRDVQATQPSIAK